MSDDQSCQFHVAEQQITHFVSAEVEKQKNNPPKTKQTKKNNKIKQQQQKALEIMTQI